MSSNISGIMTFEAFVALLFLVAGICLTMSARYSQQAGSPYIAISVGAGLMFVNFIIRVAMVMTSL